MRKKLKRAKRKSQRGKRSNWQYAESPFSGLSEEQISEVVAIWADEHEKRFNETLLELRLHMARLDPYYLLASFLMYAVMVVEGDPTGILYRIRKKIMYSGVQCLH
jgi:hypothetical protein